MQGNALGAMAEGSHLVAFDLLSLEKCCIAVSTEITSRSWMYNCSIVKASNLLDGWDCVKASATGRTVLHMLPPKMAVSTVSPPCAAHLLH